MFCLHIFREGGEVLACYIEKKKYHNKPIHNCLSTTIHKYDKTQHKTSKQNICHGRLKT